MESSKVSWEQEQDEFRKSLVGKDVVDTMDVLLVMLDILVKVDEQRARDSIRKRKLQEDVEIPENGDVAKADGQDRPPKAARDDVDEDDSDEVVADEGHADEDNADDGHADEDNADEDNADEDDNLTITLSDSDDNVRHRRHRDGGPRSCSTCSWRASRASSFSDDDVIFLHEKLSPEVITISDDEEPLPRPSSSNHGENATVNGQNLLDNKNNSNGEENSAADDVKEGAKTPKADEFDVDEDKLTMKDATDVDTDNSGIETVDKIIPNPPENGEIEQKEDVVDGLLPKTPSSIHGENDAVDDQHLVDNKQSPIIEENFVVNDVIGDVVTDFEKEGAKTPEAEEVDVVDVAEDPLPIEHVDAENYEIETVDKIIPNSPSNGEIEGSSTGVQDE